MRRHLRLSVGIIVSERHEHADTPHALALLRPRDGRHRKYRSAEPGDEIAPSFDHLSGDRRPIIRLRRQDAAKPREREAPVQSHLEALGDYADPPLGQAVIARVGAEMMPPV